MPWYSIAKLYLLKAWAWCKKHWQFLVGLIIPILIGLILRRKNSVEQMQSTVERIQDDHRREVAVIDESHRVEGEKIQEAQRRRDETVAEVEAQAAEASIELDEKKKSEIRRLVKKHEKDPAALTRELSRATGIAIWTGKKN